MHILDRDGSKHRSAEDGKLLFGVGSICATAFIVCAVFVTLDLIGR